MRKIRANVFHRAHDLYTAILQRFNSIGGIGSYDIKLCAGKIAKQERHDFPAKPLGTVRVGPIIHGSGHDNLRSALGKGAIKDVLRTEMIKINSVADTRNSIGELWDYFGESLG